MTDSNPKPLAAEAGLSLKPEHFASAQDCKAPGLWFEVHPENYFVKGPRLSQLSEIAEQFPLSLHGVSASIAGPNLIPEEHLLRLKALCEQLHPASVSEHVACSYLSDHYLVNLLPAPRTSYVRDLILANVDRLQNTLGQQILIENPAHYVSFRHEFEEPEFIHEIVQRSGCGWLLDLNNLYISEMNVGLNVTDYLDRIDLDQVGEIHIAGHTRDPNVSGLLIDSHNSPISPEVWALLDQVLAKAGAKPVLIEWDADLPTFDTLLKEREMAAHMIANYCNQHAA